MQRKVSITNQNKELSNLHTENELRRSKGEYYDVCVYNALDVIKLRDITEYRNNLESIKYTMQENSLIVIYIKDKYLIELIQEADKIFGSNNKQQTIVINKSNSIQNDKYGIQNNHYYGLIYKLGNISLNKLNFKHRTVKLNSETGLYYHTDYGITTRKSGGTLESRPNCGTTIYYNPITEDIQCRQDYDISKIYKGVSNVAEVYEDDFYLLEAGYDPIRPPKVRGELGVWTWGFEKLNANKDMLYIYLSTKTKTYIVRKKTYNYTDTEPTATSTGKLDLEFLTSEALQSVYTEEPKLEQQEYTTENISNTLTTPFNLLDIILESIIFSENLDTLDVLNISSNNFDYDLLADKGFKTVYKTIHNKTININATTYK